MVGFQHQGRHVQFRLKPEFTAQLIEASKTIGKLLDTPEVIAKLCWPMCEDSGDLTVEQFEDALTESPDRGGVMVVGLLENVKISDDEERSKFQELLRSATKTIEEFRANNA